MVIEIYERRVEVSALLDEISSSCKYASILIIVKNLVDELFDPCKSHLDVLNSDSNANLIGGELDEASSYNLILNNGDNNHLWVKYSFQMYKRSTCNRCSWK